MGAQERISSIISQKASRTKFLNVRVDKTVPSGLGVGSRLCNENCVFVRDLEIACHDDNSYREAGKALSNSELLRIIRLLHAASSMPINLHIAGDGEPTLFEDELLDLIRSLRSMEFIGTIRMTTNGTRLSHGKPDLAQRLVVAGLDELNVSLHSLKTESFKDITGIDALQLVLEGIECAVAAGLNTSINCLVREGTEAELNSYINLSRRLGVRVKFFGLLDGTGAAQEYLDGLLQKMHRALSSMVSMEYSYQEPYGGALFDVDGAIMDLKDSRVNTCPVVNCKARNTCSEGCRYYARLSPTGILQPCGVRRDNLLDMKDATIRYETVLKSLIEGGKMLRASKSVQNTFSSTKLHARPL